jgi:hypothetical protein
VTDHAATLALVDAMKARGVRSFAVGDVRVEFGPAEPAPLPDDKSVDEDVCACGHHKGIEHDGPVCLRGCPVESCAKEKA